MEDSKYSDGPSLSGAIASSPSSERYDEAVNSLKSIHDPRMPVRKKLQIRLNDLRAQAYEIEQAIAALDKNPEFETLHDTLTRVSRFL